MEEVKKRRRGRKGEDEGRMIKKPKLAKADEGKGKGEVK